MKKPSMEAQSNHDPDSSPMLWTYHSKVLNGFYQSHVFVVADTREKAIDQSVAAISEYLDQRLEEYSFCSMVIPGSVHNEHLNFESWDEDNDCEAMKVRALEAARNEATKLIQPVTNGRAVMVHSG